MALFLRSVQGTSRLCLARKQMFINTATISRTITMQIKSAQEVEYKPGETHDEKNSRLSRPMSPHLTIYQPQLTSMLSITHRGTGVALSCVTAGFGALFFFTDIPTSVEYIRGLNMPLACLVSAKALVAFPFFYHYCNGIRHLVWDAGKCLTIKQVYATGYGVIAGTTLLTILTVIFSN
ncbi:succinate dehydrogenase cytochrome b556 subunit-like [Adelges cooleyi]|uniref:succinate dehydrogenase cytochrome b556 subunit-like n=1 Tax=Adelges cooleyi TaxID=133065 RepID=UPI0021808F96|nr:succinate dehydrogenase cytochrome b556 subunit-like [Adelges cooleyi]